MTKAMKKANLLVVNLPRRAVVVRAVFAMRFSEAGATKVPDVGFFTANEVFTMSCLNLSLTRTIYPSPTPEKRLFNWSAQMQLQRI